MLEEELEEKINRRRRQILVHSIIYYRFNDSIISDAKWSIWAAELDALQKNYPNIAKNCVLSEAFANFDPSTGFDLPLDDPWGLKVAGQLLANRSRSKERR